MSRRTILVPLVAFLAHRDHPQSSITWVQTPTEEILNTPNGEMDDTGGALDDGFSVQQIPGTAGVRNGLACGAMG